jgi:hypothetical protein
MRRVTDELLAFDDQPELLSFRFGFDALLLWPFARWFLRNEAVDQALGLQAAHATGEPRTLAQRLGYVARSALLNPLTVRRTFDVVLFGTSAGVVVQKEGRWFDRINDYFALERDSLVIDGSYRGNYRHPRFPPHVRCHDGFWLSAAIAGRLKRASDKDRQTISRFMQFVDERFPAKLSTESRSVVERDLLSWAAMLPILHSLYHRFFERVHPRLILVEDGSYGRNGHLFAWARAHGIVTAEPQHGVIVPIHLAYNYGAKLRQHPDLLRQLPEHLLMYGNYWAAQIRTPSKPVIVGSPHFTTRASELTERNPRDIVIVSQGDRTDIMVQLAETLARRLPDRSIVYRLHQGEVPFRERYQRLETIANVRISNSGDIYSCYRDAELVVGHSSTALFEAAGLSLPILVHDDETSRLYIPEGLGVRFQTVEELVERARAGSTPPSNAGDFWARDWRANYRAFLHRVGVL